MYHAIVPAMLTVQTIPALIDNYIYLATDSATEQTAVIDPATEVQAPNITHILNTHHHPDHVGGNTAIKQRSGCQIVGYTHDHNRIPEITTRLDEGDTITIGNHTATVIATPGHTIGHIAYHFSEDKILFCGDTLFSMGCGRLFEGSPEQMWESLLKLRSLPDDTIVYCTHEYTQKNGEFCRHFDKTNPHLQNRMQEVITLRQQGKATLPTTMGTERRTNIFLRCDDAGLQATLGMAGRSPVEVFAYLREQKDKW